MHLAFYELELLEVVYVCVPGSHWLGELELDDHEWKWRPKGGCNVKGEREMRECNFSVMSFVKIITSRNEMSLEWGLVCLYEPKQGKDRRMKDMNVYRQVIEILFFL